MTLLEGGEMFLESADHFNHTLKPLQPFAFAADRVVKAKLTAGQMSMDFNIMTRPMSVRRKSELPNVRLLPLAHAAGWCL